MTARGRQTEFEFKSWGGARKGAGRRPRGERAGVSHREREALASRFPVHVTLRLRSGLPSLRGRAEYRALLTALGGGSERFGFRLVHYSVQGNHLHLLVEAKARSALSRGIQGLCVRIARGLNKHWARRGPVFADRYHDRILRTPREVRHALVYVLQNAKKHGVRLSKGIDMLSSAPWFDGWKEKVIVRGVEGVYPPVACARTWLMRLGWCRGGRRGGRVSVEEEPVGAPP